MISSVRGFFEVFLAAVLALGLTAARADESTMRVVVFGDDLTSGYQLQPEEAFAARLDHKLKEIGYKNVQVINMSVTGETTAGALERVNTALLARPDVVLVEFGNNDALRGINTDLIYRNLIALVGKLREDNAYVILVGTRAPADRGYSYARQLEAVYERIAKFHNIALYPFALAGVAGYAELSLADGLHPNAKGVDMMVENIYRLVDDGLRWKWDVMQYEKEFRRQWEGETMVLPLPLPKTQ